MNMTKDLTIANIINRRVETISQDLPIIEAVRLLTQKQSNSMVVINNKTEVVGVLTIQDIAAATVPHEFRENLEMAKAMYTPGFFMESCKEIRHRKVSDVMRKQFITVDTTSNIMVVMSDFLQNDLYLIPVVEKGKLLGVISRSQIKKAIHLAFNA